MSRSVAPPSPTWDVFLSYNRSDQDAVARVRRLLEDRGIRTFLDSENLYAGFPWPQALEHALSSAKAVAVFVGAKGFGAWQKREMYFALDRQATEEKADRTFPVVPVLLKDANLQAGFLFLNTWVDLRAELSDTLALDRLVQTLRCVPGPRQPVSVSICPYLGLRAFREEDAAFFFGRDLSIRELSDKVLKENRRVIGVVGSSGSGKSSVVMAGLIPELRKQRPPKPTWDAVVFKPGKYPWRSLADALVQVRKPELSPEEQSAPAAELVKSLQSGNGALDSEFRRTLEGSRGTDRLLVVIDQFEELLVQTSEETGKAFVEALFEVSELQPVTIVFTLRADYYGQALSLSRNLSDALGRGQVNIGPLVESEIRSVIERPAARVGVELEAGVSDRILRDVAKQPGRLALVEYALTAMWSPDEERITLADYEKTGGVAGSIGTSAESLYQALTPEEQEAGRLLFTRLVRVSAADEEGGDTREVVTRSEVSNLQWSIATRFEQRRLLVLSFDYESGKQTAEVAHEELIRSWRTLSEWLRKDREFLLWRQQLRGLLDAWTKLGRGSSGLLRGQVLQVAQMWQRKKRPDLTSEEQDFINRSSGRIMWVRVAAVIVLSATLLAAGWFWYQSTDSAQVAAAVREAQLTAAQITDPNDRSRAEGSLAEALAKAGRFDEARRAVAQIPKADKRAQEETRLAEVLVKAGRPEQATAAFDQAQLAAQNTEPYELSLVEISLAEALANAGRTEQVASAFNEAQRAVTQIPDPDQRSYAENTLAKALAKAGRTEQAASALGEAQRVAAQITDPSVRAVAETSLAEAQAKAGRPEQATAAFNEAQRAAAQIPDPAKRSEAETSLAEVWAEAGWTERTASAFNEAQRAVGQISDPAKRSEAETSLAEALAKAGRFDEAQRAVTQIPDPIDRWWPQTRLAESLAKAGQTEQANSAFNEAQRTVAQIPDPGKRAEEEIRLAEVLVKAGRPEQATAAFDQAQGAAQITEPYELSLVEISLAEALANAGRTEQVTSAFNEAQRAVTQLTDARERSNAENNLAKALAKAGRTEQAASALGEAQRVAAQITDPSVRAVAETSLAEAQAKAGRTEQAFSALNEAQRAAAQITNPKQRSAAETELAEAWTKAGRIELATSAFNEAQRATAQITDPKQRSEAETSLCQALAEAGRFSQARRIAEGLSSSEALAVYDAIIAASADKAHR